LPRFAANLTFLFGEHSFLDRFGAAADAGFSAVEYMFPYEEDPAELRSRLDDAALEQVLFNLPAGNWGAGERGIAAHPDRGTEFREGVQRARDYARILDVPRINCLAGLARNDVPADDQWRALVENVGYAARALKEDGRALLVEAVNSDDNPGFFLDTTTKARRLLDEVGADNVALQYDCYHVQKMEGDICTRFDRLRDRIGHVQIADAPGRHQPGTGEINYDFVLRHLDRSGYDGWVGLEYVPEGDTLSSLRWLDREALR
jgi:hydroxypyruvate isomerase